MLLVSLSGYLSSLSALLLLHGFHSQPGLLLLPLDCWHGSSCPSACASTVYTPSAASSWSTILPNEALLLHWHCFISWNRLNSRTSSPEVPLTGLPSHSSSLWPAHSHPTDLPSKLFQVSLSEVAVSASKHTVSCQPIHSFRAFITMWTNYVFAYLCSSLLLSTRVEAPWKLELLFLFF